MKLVPRLLLTLTVAAVASAPAVAQAATFSITISTPHAIVKAGEPVPLSIVMTNTSDHDIHCGVPLDPSGIPNTTFHVHIVDQNGKSVGETPLGQKRHGTVPGELPGGSGSGFSLAIPPGESMHQRVMLNEEWEVNQPGTYTIYAEKFDPLSKMTVKSNAITLTTVK